jgi:hypothetical protein
MRGEGMEVREVAEVKEIRRRLLELSARQAGVPVPQGVR